ncbi:MAG: DUF2783 domain-containing protein [Lysobacterales bacterium]
MAELNIQPNLPQADDAYQMIIDLHEGCSEQESHRRNAKLVLCLANHIGDLKVLSQAVAIASGTSEPATDRT